MFLWKIFLGESDSHFILRVGIDFQEWRESKFAFSDKSFLGIASQSCKNLPDIVGLSLHDVEDKIDKSDI